MMFGENVSSALELRQDQRLPIAVLHRLGLPSNPTRQSQKHDSRNVTAVGQAS